MREPNGLTVLDSWEEQCKRRQR